MRALRMEFRSSFRLILWAGGASALILTTLLMGCTPGSSGYFWSGRQPVLDLGVPRPLDEASGSLDGEWTLSGIRSSAPSSLRIRWNRRSDGDRIETYSGISARRLWSLTGGFRSGEVSIIESKAGELTLRVQEWSSMSSIISGTWRFDPDPAYGRRTAELLRSKPDESQWLQLLFAEVDTWYMVVLYDATVEKPTVDELLRARWNGVSEDYLEGISRIGARFHPEDIIQLRQHGVSADFLASAVAVDRRFAVDQIIQLRQHGISADFLESVRQTDPWITVDKIVQMRQNGVPEEFFATARAVDSLLTVDDIVKLRQHGVTTDFLADIKQIETRYSTDDIISLRQHGVSSKYVKAAQESGISIPTYELIRMRSHGVTAEFFMEFKQIHPDADIDQAIRLHQHGVTVNFLRQIEESGGQYSIDDVIRLRQHGVDGDYIKALNVPGRAPLDADTIIHLRQRGVDAETARKLREQ
jgi:hypothetical protein